MTQIFTNNAATATVGAITNVATSITVADGSKFPAPVAPDFALLTLIGLDGNGNEYAWEVVKLTERAANVLTVVRGQEGTAAAAWADATRIELRLTAAGMAAKLDADLSTLTDAGTLDGTETLPVNKTGAKRTTVQKILDWIKTQAITWTAVQGVDINNPTRGVLTKLRNTAGASWTGAQLQFTQLGVADWTFGQPAGVSALAWWSGRSDTSDGTERMRLTSTGSLGLGTATPNYSSSAWSLAVTAEAPIAAALELSTTRADADGVAVGGVDWQFRANAANHQLVSRIHSNTDGATATQRGGSILFSTKANASTSLTERVRITQAGFVGVGLNNPDSWLHVVSDIHVGSAGNNLGLVLGNAIAAIPASSVKSHIASANSTSGLVAGSLILQPRTGVSATLNFCTEGTVKAYFDSTGRFIQNGFTQLGESAPKIKVKKLTGTTPAAAAQHTIAHGLTNAKIISFSVQITFGGGLVLPPGQAASLIGSSGYNYGAWLNGANIVLGLVAGESDNLFSKAFTVLVTYEE